jgi:hypothetical protein
LAQKSDGKVIISTELDNSRIPKGVKEISGSLGGLKTVVSRLGAAIGAAFSVMTIVNFARESVNAANALSDALTGLKSILDGQGRSFSDAEKFLQEYTADGLVPMTNAITAYKNLASRGYDDSQIRSVMQALKDASAFGRQASYSMGEAVQSATEGLKNENSILVDNAGVTKNVAKMWEEYAASIGTTANNLTQQQKIQAEVNGILEESKYQAGDAAKVAGTLSGQLSQLSVNFNNLKVAVGNALRPMVQSFLPVVNAAVAALTRFANAVAQVVGALFGNFGTAVQEVADGYGDAASGAEDLADATEKAGKAAKKYLAGFDELTRIGDSASGAADAVDAPGTGVTVPVTADGVIQDNLSPQLQALVDKIMALLEPLKQIDLGPLAASFDRLRTAVEPLTTALFAGLEWAWYNILVPLAAWTIEDLLPAFLDLVSAALGVLNEVILVFQPLATWLWENFLAPVAEWTGGMIVEVLGQITQGLTAISDWISENQKLVETMTVVVLSFMAAWEIVKLAPLITGITTALGGLITALTSYSIAGTIAGGVGTALGTVIHFLMSPITLAVLAIGALIAAVVLLAMNWETVAQVATDVWDGIVSVWEDVSGWFDENVLSPLAQGFRDTFNGIIGFINGLISGAQSGINSIIRGINRISFTVPDWVPGIGGMTMGFNLSQVSFPQIPYLAQGAVLPANKPFLAMVGDQKHGTNVEAPLATIQEAVALVMDDYAASNLAGQEAIVEVLREILEAVLGIEIGDDVIGQAVARYNRKMAVVRGGT